MTVDEYLGILPGRGRGIPATIEPGTSVSDGAVVQALGAEYGYGLAAARAEPETRGSTW
jgi:hypothetical protein